MTRFDHLAVLTAIAILLGAPGAALAEERTPYELQLSQPGGPTDPAYAPVAPSPTPLPRYRLGPDGENATPPVDPAQRLQPYAIELPRADFAPDSCLIESPPEYEPVDGVLYRWATGSWDGLVTDLVASLTGDPTKDEIAYVVVADAAQQSAAETDFLAAGADLSKVEFIQMPTNSIWMRDYGPHFIWEGGAKSVVDSHYYPGRDADNFIPTLVGDDYFVHPTYDMPLYYSGGNFMPSSIQHGFITSLIYDDNPGFTEQKVLDLYGEYQGIDTLHVFPRLPSSVDGTGHIDMWMYLVDEDTVIIGEFLPGEDPTAIEITNDAVPYMENLGYTVHRVPAFNATHPGQGNTHYTYTNAFRVNDRIFIPTYGEGDPNYVQYDNQAIATWEAAAGPGVEIVPINSYDIIWASGAIHCIVKQVPRYTDALPSACATSPGGGELLVPDTLHEITWTATDDGSVDTIDLAYSTDGGASYPPDQVIATGLPNDGRYLWTVPQSETGIARVRVTAVDDDANGVDAESVRDVTFESALQTSYGFSSGGGIDRFAYDGLVSGWSDVDGNRRPAQIGTAFGAADYAAVSSSDDSRFVGQSPLFAHPAQLFELAIAEDPAEILEVAVTWEGFADDCAQSEIYVWDYVASQWCDGAGSCGEDNHLENFAGRRDETLTGRITGDFARYIDGTGQMTLLAFVERSQIFAPSRLDFLSVTVTHDPCAGPDLDFDGFADACDNCVAAANADQLNADADARGDACDCAVNDGSAFSQPFEIRNVSWLDKVTLTWDSDAANSGSGTRYDVLRGDVLELPVGGGAGEACQGSDLGDTSLDGLPTPASGDADYYLVRGSNVCGAGSYGFDGQQPTPQERTSGACP